MAVPCGVHGQRQGLPGAAGPAMLQCRPAQEFSFGPRALKEALVSSDPTLQRLYASAFTPAERLFLAEAYNPQRTLFCTLLIHTAFDWLLSRPEAPEDFQTFHASLPPRRQSPARKHIYLQPIGRRWRRARSGWASWSQPRPAGEPESESRARQDVWAPGRAGRPPLGPGSPPAQLRHRSRSQGPWGLCGRVAPPLLRTGCAAPTQALCRGPSRDCVPPSPPALCPRPGNRPREVT